MDVDRYRRTRRGARCRARRSSAGMLVAAVLGLTGCLPAAGGEGTDVQAPGPDGQTRAVPASAQLPPPLPT